VPNAAIVKDSTVVAPSEMIMLGDSKPGDSSSAKPTRGQFDANLDPRDAAELPSNRHNFRTVLMFADGHSESARRKDIVDPKNDVWRARWNNDHLAHSPRTKENPVIGDWAVNWNEQKLDP
jgi:prepilin-type processing-associated H-X9-DG protein